MSLLDSKYVYELHIQRSSYDSNQKKKFIITKGKNIIKNTKNNSYILSKTKKSFQSFLLIMVMSFLNYKK